MIDGLTLLRRWRESGVAVPVLVLTARASWHEKVQGIDAGADDYVVKPFRMEEAQDFDRDSNTVEVFIARLRRKLGTEIIETVRGLGYRVPAEGPPS